MAFLWTFSWVLIPIVAILAGGFKEWLKFKEKQLQLGQSTENLGTDLKQLSEALKSSQAQNESLLNRIQNLEAIVTSQVWDVLHDGEKSTEEKKLELESVKPKIALPPVEDEIAGKAEKLARRLRV